MQHLEYSLSGESAMICKMRLCKQCWKGKPAKLTSIVAMRVSNMLTTIIVGVADALLQCCYILSIKQRTRFSAWTECPGYLVMKLRYATK